METTNSTIEQAIPPPLPINNSSSRRKQSKPNRLEHPTSDLIDLNPPEHENDPSDRVSLNCEDGSLSSSESTHEQLIIDENVKQVHETILDFSLKTNLNHDQTNATKKARSLKRKHPNGNHSLTDEKIFHPDAFCNICQKEFCNKYFLKTHLANKHGIFDQESTSSPSLSLLSGLINSEQDDNHENDINNNNQISHLIEEDGDEQDGTGGLTHFENDNEQLPQPSTTTKLFEDFCEICQKHFCNKYYLRKHKLDVHGVQTDCNIKSYKSSKTTTTSAASSSSPLNVQQNLSLLLNPLFSTDQINQRRYTDSSNDSSILSKSSSYPTSDAYTNQISPCHLCGKKFQSNEYLQLHLMNKHQISNLIKKIKLETNETTNQNPSASPTPIVDTYFAAKMADRVSCDICHKQVCNKYFLKTHKFKVHGIGSDTNLVSSNDDEKPSTPINDQSPSADDHLDENESQSERIPTPNEFADGNSSIVCELCSKNFPSKFLFHIHMTNVHGIQSTTTTVNDINSKISNNKKPTTTTTNTVKLKQTPQVQLRVTCQVCKKELCNKYFLRAHMRNVHNINLDEIDKQNSLSTDIQKSSISNDNQDLNDHLTDSNPSENPLQSNEILSMQPFLVESDDQLYKDSFVPCMVYLPCRQRVTQTIEIALRLKPIEKTD